MRYLWIGLGWVSVGLGVAGAFLPLLPTTPFLLLAAFAFSKGSERLHNWLMEHQTLGPPIRNWQAEKAISRQVKMGASVGIVAIFMLSVVLQAPNWALMSQACVLVFVSYFLWTRPEPGKQTSTASSSAGGKSPHSSTTDPVTEGAADKTERANTPQ